MATTQANGKPQNSTPCHAKINTLPVFTKMACMSFLQLKTTFNIE